jgi:hypothetical protein
MRVIITEDIVKKALDESIDEFMLEEGWEGWKNLWNNPNVQKIRNGVGKAWNGYKNFLAMYMDNKTNGQWNRKYNIQPKGKGGTVVGHYLQNWFKNHYNRLYDIIYGNYYGNKQYFYLNLNGSNVRFQHNWKNNSYTLNYYGTYYTLNVDYNNKPEKIKIKNGYGGEIENTLEPTYNKPNNSYEFTMPPGSNFSNIIVYIGEDNSTPEEYIAKNCTANDFEQATKNVLEDGKFRYAARNYINNIQKINNENIEKLKNDPNEKINYNKLLNMFRVDSFYFWCGQNKTTAYNDNSKNNSRNNNQQYKPFVDNGLEMP